MPPRDFFGFVGELIEPQYRVDDVIGEGGFSVVYRGHHLGLDEPVAIKCLKMPAGLTPSMVDAVVERFQAESRIMYRLSQGNLNIVRSVSSGTAESRVTGALVPYMVLEWLEGVSLFQDLKERRQRSMIGRTLLDTIRLLDPAAMAIEYAHAQGVVHRDLKPGNIFMATTRDGVRTKVLDFGLAKVLTDDGIGLGPAQHTMSQGIFCSLSYGAPEQFDPQRGPIGPWTDVYSFAFVILEVLMDKKVRPAETMVDAARRAFDEKADLSATNLGLQLPPKIEELLLRAVQVDKTKRPPDMHALWVHIKRAVKEEGMKVRVPATYNGPESAPSMVTQVGPGSPGFDMRMLQGKPSPHGSPLGSSPGVPAVAESGPTLAAPEPGVQVIVTDPGSNPEVQSIPLIKRHPTSRPPPPDGIRAPSRESTVPVGSFESNASNGSQTSDVRASQSPERVSSVPSSTTNPPRTLSQRPVSLASQVSSRPPPTPKRVALVAFVIAMVVLTLGAWAFVRFG
jgi:serine/threonine protein kinase